MERVSRIWNMNMSIFFITKFFIKLLKKTIYTKRWERHDLDEAWGDHSMAWWQEGTEGKITKYIALGLNIKALIKRRNPKRRDSGLTYGKWCVCCRASTWCSTESPLATQPWPRLSGTQQPSLPRWSSTGRFRRWWEACTTPILSLILLFIRLAWFSPSARTSINPFSPDWRQKAFQLLKNLHSCHRQNTLKWNKDILWGFRVILDWAV